ncbi:MAG: type II secretion system F family protein [Magnetococcus sp. DMHC-6]
MKIFIWKGTAANGTLQKGEMVAINSSVVLAKLRKQGYQNIAIEQQMSKTNFFESKAIQEKDIVVFIRQLSVMVQAGFPLNTCFNLLGKRSAKPAINRASLRIRESIELGKSLSAAMALEPILFDEFTINLIRVAEKSGVLNTVLERIATYKEKALHLKGKIKSALTYPFAVLTISILIFYLLMVKVVPVFVTLFKSFNAELPLPTQIIIMLSEFTQAWWWVVVVGILLFYKFFSFSYRRYDLFRYKMDYLLLKLPYLGEIFLKAAIARFARSFSTMLAAGTPILECLEGVSKISGNRVLEQVIRRAKNAIMEGRSLTDPLEESDIFPPLVTQMIFIGESTGKLDFMLNKIADFYDEEVDRAVDTLKALMEPVIMVILGAMIGGLVLSMYMPLFKIGLLV